MSRDEMAPTQGQDSFLDVVANLVGILIILIMVIGVRARQAMVRVHNRPEPTAHGADQDGWAQVAALQGDLAEQLARLQRGRLEVAYRKAERDALLRRLTLAEKQIARQQALLEESQKQSLEQERRRAALEEELKSLQQRESALAAAIRTPKVLYHYPTPLAKTVFGKEVHFRLLEGRLVYVPLEELLERFKAEVREKLWKFQDRDVVTDSVGPLGGFQLRYTLRRSIVAGSTSSGSAGLQQRIELVQVELVPVQELEGMTVKEALQPNSPLRQILAQRNPDKTTITVWVYPDSFGEFRALRDALLPSGFLVAARPLPHGQLITGSPHGSRSHAQ